MSLLKWAHNNNNNKTYGCVLTFIWLVVMATLWDDVGQMETRPLITTISIICNFNNTTSYMNFAFYSKNK